MFEIDARQPPVNPFFDMAAVLTRASNDKKSRRRAKKGKRGRMRKLNFQLKKMCEHNQDGSYATQHDRERELTLVANQLYEMGYQHMDTTSLKPKHVETLVERWVGENLSSGTIKNRMSALRWWSQKIGKPNVVARDNAHYGIGKRTFVTNTSKARELTSEQLAKVSDPYTAMSLRLQAAFGLRREESLKIQPVWADRGDRIVLKDSWCKGSRKREIPIRTELQRQVLNDAKSLAGRGSLIPIDKNYAQQLERFKYQCGKANIDRVHGHRHQYAQERYKTLTGRECPARGGLKSKELNKEQKALDREVRLTISRELGHAREQITAIYLGR